MLLVPVKTSHDHSAVIQQYLIKQIIQCTILQNTTMGPVGMISRGNF